jgi:hypothetical protein
VRQALQNNNWNWGDALTKEDNQKIGVHLARSNFNVTLSFWTGLPYFASVKDFDMAEVINSFLKNIQPGQLYDPPTQMLARYAPLWLGSDLAMENAKLFIEKTHNYLQLGEVTWMLGAITETERAELTEYVKAKIAAQYQPNQNRGDIAMADMAVTAVLPWGQLPTTAKESLMQNWVDLFLRFAWTPFTTSPAAIATPATVT